MLKMAGSLVEISNPEQALTATPAKTNAGQLGAIKRTTCHDSNPRPIRELHPRSNQACNGKQNLRKSDADTSVRPLTHLPIERPNAFFAATDCLQKTQQICAELLENAAYNFDKTMAVLIGISALSSVSLETKFWRESYGFIIWRAKGRK